MQLRNFPMNFFVIRAEILPTVTESLHQMTEAEKEQLLRMNNFFCGLYFLIALADTAEETLKLWESQSGNEISVRHCITGVLNSVVVQPDFVCT